MFAPFSGAFERALRPAAILCLSSCTHRGVLDPAGEVAEANRQILFNAFAIMMAIVVPTILATLIVAWWFRAGNGRARYRPDFVFSGQIELVVWSIPTLVILFLGGVIWIGSHRIDPHRPLSGPNGLEVDVVSLDWKWLFIYPAQGVASVNELVVPARQPVHFRLTSASVMNVFFVPQLGSQIYAMNGMETELWLRADREGDFYGRSAHFSGDGFPQMSFTVKAVAPDAFAAWIDRARASPAVLDSPFYARLARQSKNVTPFTMRAVQPGLFGDVVHQRLEPSPGPAEALRANPHISPRGG